MHFVLNMYKSQKNLHIQGSLSDIWRVMDLWIIRIILKKVKMDWSIDVS